MFIRAQFSEQTFRDLIKFRTVSGERPCSKLFWELGIGTYAAVTEVNFVGITQLSLGGQVPAPYPNVLGPPVSTFQQSQIVMRMEYDLVAEIAVFGVFTTLTTKVTADFGLDLRVENGKDMLYLSVISATADNAEFQQKFDLTKVVADSFGTGGVEMGMVKQVTMLSSQMDNLISVRHADLGFNPTTGMLEFRFEMTSGSAPPPDVFIGWTQFYNNAFDSLSQGAPWAMFYDERLGTTIIQHSLTQGLDGSGKFSRDGGVSTYFDPSSANFHMGVEGEVVDACYCFNPFDKIDLDVRIWGDITFSASGNKLRMDVRFDWKITDIAEAGCCLFNTLVFFPLVGIDFVTSAKSLKWWEYLINLVISPCPILLMIGGMLNFSAKDSDLQPQGQLQTDPNDDKHYWFEFDLPHMVDVASCGGAAMTLSIDSLTTRFDGLVMVGGFVLPPIVDPVVSVQVTQPFKYAKPSYGCSGGYDKPGGYEAVISLTRTSGSYDFSTCDASFATINNDIKWRSIVEIKEAGCPKAAVVTIRVPYWAYDFQTLYVVISTSVGAFIVPLEPGTPVSADTRSHDDLIAQAERVDRCYVKSHAFWDIRWLVDPQPFEEAMRTKELWAVTGMVSENTQGVVIESERGERLMRVDTRAQKYFKTFLVHEGEGIRLVQELKEEWTQESPDTGEFHVVQVLAAIDDEIELRDVAVSLDVLALSGSEDLVQRQRMVVYGERAATIYRFVANGRAVQEVELDVAGSRWTGRRDSTLTQRQADGALLTYNLRSSSSHWDQTGVPLESTAGVEREISYADEYDHLVVREDWIRDGSESVARVRGNRLDREQAGYLVSAALSPKLAQGELVYTDNESATLRRVTPDTFALLTADGRRVQLLKAVQAQD